jgi:Tol biopolymer transport system component
MAALAVALMPGTAQSAFQGDNGRIACQSDRAHGDWHIYSMTASGGDRTGLTSAHDYSPNWSADGKHIVFTSYHDNECKCGIYKMDADGGNQTQPG